MVPRRIIIYVNESMRRAIGLHCIWKQAFHTPSPKIQATHPSSGLQCNKIRNFSLAGDHDGCSAG